MLKDIEHALYKRWLVGYAPSIILVALILVSIFFTASYFFSYKPLLTMEKWNCYGKLSSESEWIEARDGLLLASKLNPWDADIYMSLGNIYEWKAVEGAAWSSDAKTARKDAVHYFRKATEQRPSWSKAWVYLSQNMVLNRQLDDEVFMAIENGFRFGRWEPDTNNKLLWLTIGIWKNLPENLKETVRKQVKQNLANDNSFQSMLAIVVRFQWFDELLNIIKNEEQRELINRIRNNPDLMRNLLNQSNQDSSDFIC